MSSAPDVLLPSVIHSLHVNLGHASFTVTKRNFEQYYYNRMANKMIKSYIQSCVTCALSNKFDIKKTVPETSRSLVPDRPRQYIYCDQYYKHMTIVNDDSSFVSK